MSAKWGYDWVRLYQNPSPAWQALSYSTRGLGYEILRASASGRGRIECGTKSPFEVVALLCAIAPLDRRRAKKDFDELLADGFIVLEGTTIVVRNFERAQETKTEAAARKAAQRAREAANAPPAPAPDEHPDDTGATNPRRPNDKPSSSERQTTSLQTDATPPKDSIPRVTVTPLLEGIEKRKRIQEEEEEIVPTSQEVGTTPPVEPPPAPKAQLSLTSGEPKAKTPRPDPLPFPVYAGLQAIAGKTQRFALPAQSELSKGHVIALGKQVRRFPKLEEWTLAGEYLEANGDGWRGSVGVSLVASDRFGEIVAAARAWEKAGRRKMDIRGSPVDPTKGRAESWEHKRLGLEDIGVEVLGNG